MPTKYIAAILAVAALLIGWYLWTLPVPVSCTLIGLSLVGLESVAHARFMARVAAQKVST